MKTKTAEQLDLLKAAVEYALAASVTAAEAEEPSLAQRLRALATEAGAIRRRYALVATNQADFTTQEVK